MLFLDLVIIVCWGGGRGCVGRTGFGGSVFVGKEDVARDVVCEGDRGSEGDLCTSTE